jgi:S-adenosylmethionine decarboxylase
MEYKTNPIGNEISCVMYGINNKTLNNHKKLRSILLKALKQENFKILKETAYEFQPKGFTIMILIAESHAAIHTYPEYNSLYFHIHSCRGPESGREVYRFIKKELEPTSISFNERKIVLK